MVVCTNCGEENPERFRLCGFCGTPLAISLPVHEVRKTVTIVFSRPQGLDEPRGAARLGVAARGHDPLLRGHARGARGARRHGREVHRRRDHGGVRPADAARGRRAAGGPRGGRHAGGARAAERGARARAGASGSRTAPASTPARSSPATRSTGQRLVTGDAVNVAARLEQAAPARTRCCSASSTYRLVRDAVEVEEVEPLELKGKAERVPAYRLIGVLGAPARERGAAAPARRARRGARGARRRARRGGRRGLAASRHARRRRRRRQVAASSRSSRAPVDASRVGVPRAAASPYGDGITFWPMREMRPRGGGDRRRRRARRGAVAKLAARSRTPTSPRVSPRPSASPTSSSRSTRSSGRFASCSRRSRRRGRSCSSSRTSTGPSRRCSTCSSSSSRLRDAPLLLVAATRPTLYEHRPEWGAHERARRVELAALSADAEPHGRREPDRRGAALRRAARANRRRGRGQPALRRAAARVRARGRGRTATRHRSRRRSRRCSQLASTA